MGSYQGDIFNHALSNSLKTIRVAKSRLHILTEHGSTQSVLASQIELCNILLDEIQSISHSLERRIGTGSAISRRSVVTRRSRSSRHPVAPLRDSLNHTKRRKLALRPREPKPEATKRDKEEVT